MRGYAAHAKAVRKLVHLAQLHLGHLAKSFGLQEPPTTLVRQQQKKGASARAPSRAKAGGKADAYTAAGNEYVAGGAPRKLSLAERMRKQPAARRATAVGSAVTVGVAAAFGKPLAGGGAKMMAAARKSPTTASVSEFGAGLV